MNDALFASYRSEFPITQRYLYFDHAGIAPLSNRVVRAIEEAASEGSHAAAFCYPRWIDRVARTRRLCADFIHAAADDIAFVKNTSHGLSIVAHGLDWRPGDNVIVYEKEFPANLFPWFSLRTRGVEVRIIPYRDGRISVEDIDSFMDARTRLLSLSAVQFTDGFRLDLHSVGALCRERGILFCVDAIQALGAISIDVVADSIDFLAADAHKWLLGPEGIGIFFCRKGLAERLSPPLIGWKSVQNDLSFEAPEFILKTNALRFEEGSLNLIGIAGLGAALELLTEIGMQQVEKRVLDLGEVIIGEARSRQYRLVSHYGRHERGGNVTISGQFYPALVRDRLRERGAMVNVRGGGLRISPHFYNTQEEIVMLFGLIDRIASEIAAERG